ncbi:DNA-directed RNA polymerase subunit A'' [Candidatus Woesearchaeota archaeon]|nr:DNA-directed RNA polymerase subunit A'' [Candidatus Woesearchaeota archaeon]
MEEQSYKDYEGKLPRKLIEELKVEAKERNLSKEQVRKVLEYVREEYDAAKINPGEAIGILTAESFGEPSTQMSIKKDEKIIIKYKEKMQVIEIGKFVDRIMEIQGALKLKSTEITPLQEIEVYVPSINQEEKVEWKRVTECSRHKTDKPLMRITTASGRQITATDNHSFVIRKENKIVPMVGKALKIGDRLPIVNKVTITNAPLQEIHIYENIEEAEGIMVTEEGLLIKKGTVAKPVRNTIKLDRITGHFIGAYLAEGMANYGQVCISNMDDTYGTRIKEFVEKTTLKYREDRHHRGFAESRDIKISSTLLAEFMRKTCGHGAAGKRVPLFAYSADDEFVAHLLRGYFDGDGNVHVARKMIRVSSNAKELIDGIALLLARFSIFSYKTKDKKGQYWLLIPYKYAPRFLAYIGSDIESKQKSLEELATAAKKFWNKRSLDYTDMISGFGNLFHDAAKKVGMRTRYVNNFTKRQRIGRTTLYRYKKMFEEMAKKKKSNIDQELEVMNRIINSDIIWDAIAKIEYEDATEHVYDLSVPGLETFTTAEGIVTHNTLNVFHFAGVAEVSVTQGLPRLIEILDARKEISTPSMEIYLKKNISKDMNEVKRVAAMIKETKLNEIATEFSIDLNKLQVVVSLNQHRMKDLRLKPEQVAEALNNNMKGVKANTNGEKIVIKTKAEENELMETYKLKEKAKEVFIKGVKGIAQVLPVKNQDEFIIITSGSNLKDVIEIEEVDETRTTTNNLFEVLKVFGIEAARQNIIREAQKVIEDQGLDVDIRHIMFIADTMTTTGTIKGITRSGITGEKKSVLARASFETPLRHLINASLVGEEDELNSVIENVMLNQPVPLGTGLPDLVTRVKKETISGKDVKK